MVTKRRSRLTFTHYMEEVAGLIPSCFILDIINQVHRLSSQCLKLSGSVARGYTCHKTQTQKHKNY